MFLAPHHDLPCLHLVEASLSFWSPTGSFDLITCVHGLHYTLLHALGVHALGPGRPGWTTTQVYPARSPPIVGSLKLWGLNRGIVGGAGKLVVQRICGT